jgi:biotin operon repressor
MRGDGAGPATAAAPICGQAIAKQLGIGRASVYRVLR